ncbi:MULTISPECIES: energy-coupling factor transporter transmembrane component T family protein [Kocuria]|uniref:energy-coupling factor transporter transmembrane component T family protein n=1 Tax=Kocuria TaxID=57493 RepID=UPI00065FE78B|nr:MULTISPECIES: energy-coupling factor transporter transmembrane protein EcfT [Kocuria]MCT1367404.1 energy-coupling factor transporter transmembrane protein EcfT [Rothia sp. p3-SID1597]RUQ22493.1 energy-coupling factor transporter transmembrane protein EcfT [Kocuria sp. HSID16901]
MISLYQPGSSLIHRLSAGYKLAAFAVIALALSFAPATWVTVVLCVILPVLGYAVARLGTRTFFRDLRGLLLLVVFLAVTQLIFLDPMDATRNTVRVISIVLLAQVVTRTTPIDGMIETCERVLGPFRRFGVKPERMGLAMALTLTSVNQLGGIVRDVRDAQAARGVRIAPWAWVMPMLILTLQHADQVGDALDARGVGDDEGS